MNRLLILPVLLFTLLVGNPAFSADFQKGLAAHKSGDYATALRELTPLAEQGNADAQNKLGVMYEHGQGVPQNYETAVKWYRLAAEQGDSYAQKNLGVMYEYGRGVPFNYENAVKWFRLAANQGHPGAVFSLEILERNGKSFFYMYRRLAKWKPSLTVTPPVIVRKSPSPTPRRRTDPDKVISASSGSGFAVSSNGHVITNYHVIEGCQKVKIHHKGKSIPATVVTFDPRNDLALLKGNFRPSTVLPLSTNSPELLQDVYVAGFPFGRKVSTSVKVTKGIISSLTGIGNNFSNIQIDAALQPGNSGGPILDDRGNVVGVAVARLDKIKTLKKFGSLPENTNFGIKASVVRSILESSNVPSPSPNRSSISKSKLGKMISDATYYLSCWMTTAQIEKMRSKKVIFQTLD